MSRRELRTPLVLPGIWLFAAAVFLQAQEGGGVLAGTVTDRSNAVVPNITISITHTGTGLTRSTATDASGDYVFRALPVGTYDVTASGSGFATLRSTGAVVSVGSTTRLDLQVQVATVTQDVTVQARAAILDTESGSSGVLLSSNQVTNLPLNGRNFLQLVPLEPGVRANTATGRQSFTFNGAPAGQGINLLVDGTDATGIETAEIGGIFSAPNQSTFTLGLDSISEFVVHAGNYSAQYGKSMGGVIEVVTKSGTNDLHGNVFYFFRNDVLNANTIQGNAAGLPRPPLRFNQFGGNTGAPIVRNKMFFWLGYEGARRRTGLTSTYTVLSDLGRSHIKDPAIAKAVDQYLPRANRPPTSNPDLALLVRNEVQPVPEDIGTARYDYRISAKDNLFVRYNIHSAFGVSPVLGALQTTSERQQLGTISWTRVVSPSTTLNLRTGVNRIVSGQESTAPEPGFVVNGIFGVSGSFLFNNALAYTYAGDYTHIRGKHTLLAGVEYHTTRVNRAQRGFANYSFLPGPNQLSNFYNNVPDQFASPSVIGGNSGSGGSSSGYFEDSIKLSRKVTISAGLRYDYYFRISEKYGRIIGIDGSTFPVSQIRFKKPGEEFLPANFNGFGPRFGFAYSPTGKTVIRGGYGIFVGLNFPAIATGSAFTFVPPLIPASLYDPNYAQTSITFARRDRPDLFYPNVAFVTKEALLANAPPPSPFLSDPTDMKNAYTHQWSLRVEQEIAKDTKLSVGYVGTRSLHILGNDYFNLIRPLQGNTRENPALSNINLKASKNNGFYNAMQVTFNRRLNNGLQFDVNYTWSHSTDDIFGFSGVNDPGGGNQTSSLRQNWGNSNFDVRHLLTVDYYYELPLAGLTAVPGALRQGWTLGGITMIRTGTPYDVGTGSNVGDGIHTQRPDITCKNASTGASAGLFAQVLNPACFARPGMDPATGFFVGNLARNAYYGPASVNFDFNISKNTRLGEHFTHQLRAEFFNALNDKNFQAPVSALNNPNFGRILGAASGRAIQFAMKLIF